MLLYLIELVTIRAIPVGQTAVVHEGKHTGDARVDGSNGSLSLGPSVCALEEWKWLRSLSVSDAWSDGEKNLSRCGLGIREIPTMAGPTSTDVDPRAVRTALMAS
jgi:hypothetical protein